jgi:hypothetical protein
MVIKMEQFTTTILQFNEQGEKTGWRYIEVPQEIAGKLKPGEKKSFRVKGWLDDYAFEGVSLLPMGGGNFILPINATIRKGIHKNKGAMLQVRMEADDRPFILNPDMLECLSDEPKALAYFQKLPKSHQNYYSKWIDSAKTEATKAKRIALTVTACARQMHFSEMLREQKADAQNKI